MIADFPQAGQIIEYHYLWKWQAARGETEGRKKRPSCVVLVVANRDGNHVLFIAPITSKAPTEDSGSIWPSSRDHSKRPAAAANFGPKGYALPHASRQACI